MIAERYWNKTVEAAPLAVFRFLFGLLMLLSIIRFASYGWIDKLYFDPIFHFHYYGFEWVTVPPTWLCYGLFALCGISAIAVALGWHYHQSIVIFFLSFSYIELMDKSTYLNHYYFISVVSFLLIFLPANRYWSYDVKQGRILASNRVRAWQVDAIKVLVTIVYFYAGLAKINEDWLCRAMPMSIWMPGKLSITGLGDLMHQRWVHYFFSWCGMLYDITIAWLLWYRPTRKFAFFLVIIFHLLTALMFPIGMFPYIMILAASIFFSASHHERFLGFVNKWLPMHVNTVTDAVLAPIWTKWIVLIVLLLQLVFPWRYLWSHGDLHWEESAYRFGWRVMLHEKTGDAQFRILNKSTGQFFYVQNNDFLTPLQRKEMSTQADFIWEYARMLERHFVGQGHSDLAIYVDSHASLNGRAVQTFVDGTIDLLSIEKPCELYRYIQPLEDD